MCSIKRVSLELSEIPLAYTGLLSRKNDLCSLQSVQLLCIYNNLGQILERGFNLASKKFTFLLERACVAPYRICLSKRPLSEISDEISYYILFVITNEWSDWICKNMAMEIFLIYFPTESCSGACSFVFFSFIVTFYFNRYRIGCTRKTLMRVSHWLLTYHL